MTKAMLQKSNEIFIHSCEILIRQVAEYEAMMESCTIMPREYYKEMIEDFHAMKSRIAELEKAKRPDVASILPHDQMLTDAFKAMMKETGNGER